MGGGPCSPPLSPRASFTFPQPEDLAARPSQQQSCHSRDWEEATQEQADLATSEGQASTEQSLISTMALSPRAILTLLTLLVALTASSAVALSLQPCSWPLCKMLGSCRSVSDSSTTTICAEKPGSSASASASALQGRVEHLTCEQAAYVNIMGSCDEILSDDTQMAELVLRLTNCQLKLTGKDVITCAARETPGSWLSCVASLTEQQYSVFNAYFNNLSSACHSLQ